jgi:excisionase family DNA binding protein
MPEQVDTSRAALSTAEASQIAGVDQTYIQRLLRQERIEGVRIGTVWLVYEDSLRAFMAQPRKRGPKGSRKKSEHDQVNPSPDSRQTEVRHEEGEAKRAGSREAEASE